MNQLEMLVMILGEENSEVSQMCSKINRFSMDEVFPDPINNADNLTNKQRTYKELDDVMAMIALLNQLHGFDYEPNHVNIAAKQEKVMNYLEYSRQLGTLTD